MGKEILLTLDSLDVGQILDGLRLRQESWAKTAMFLRNDYFPDEPFVCEEYTAIRTRRRELRTIISASLFALNSRSTSKAARSWYPSADIAVHAELAAFLLRRTIGIH